MNLTKIAEVAAHECERQEVGLDRLAMLLTAYSHVHTLMKKEQKPPWKGIILSLAKTIEPLTLGRLRTVPVRFSDYSFGADPDVLEDGFNSLCNSLPKLIRISHVDVWIKSFLQLHPFIDGNGRLAWLLRVWLLNQWENPEPLPDYFGENKNDSFS